MAPSAPLIMSTTGSDRSVDNLSGYASWVLVGDPVTPTLGGYSRHYSCEEASTVTTSDYLILLAGTRCLSHLRRLPG
jgi:hypothetical protein